MQLWSAAGLSYFETLTSKIYEMTEKDIRLGFDTSAQARKLFIHEMSVSTIISALCWTCRKSGKGIWTRFSPLAKHPVYQIQGM